MDYFRTVHNINTVSQTDQLWISSSPLLHWKLGVGYPQAEHSSTASVPSRAVTLEGRWRNWRFLLTPGSEGQRQEQRREWTAETRSTLWDALHHQVCSSYVIVEHVTPKPHAVMCCHNSLHSSGFGLSTGCRDYLPFSHKSINEVSGWIDWPTLPSLETNKSSTLNDKIRCWSLPPTMSYNYFLIWRHYWQANITVSKIKPFSDRDDWLFESQNDVSIDVFNSWNKVETFMFSDSHYL